MKAETFDGEEEVGWWTPDGRQTHVGPPQHWDRDQVLLLPGKVASLLLETVDNLLLETFGITLLDCAASLRNILRHMVMKEHLTGYGRRGDTWQDRERHRGCLGPSWQCLSATQEVDGLRLYWDQGALGAYFALGLSSQRNPFNTLLIYYILYKWYCLDHLLKKYWI